MCHGECVGRDHGTASRAGWSREMLPRGHMQRVSLRRLPELPTRAPRVCVMRVMRARWSRSWARCSDRFRWPFSRYVVGCFSAPGLVAFQRQGWLLFSARVGCFSVPGSLRWAWCRRCGSCHARRGAVHRRSEVCPARNPRLSQVFPPRTPACSHARTLSRPHVRTFSRRRQSCITARPCSCTTSCRSSCGGTWRRFRRVVGKRIRCGGRRSRRWVRCL